MAKKRYPPLYSIDDTCDYQFEIVQSTDAVTLTNNAKLKFSKIKTEDLTITNCNNLDISLIDLKGNLIIKDCYNINLGIKTNCCNIMIVGSQGIKLADHSKVAKHFDIKPRYEGDRVIESEDIHLPEFCLEIGQPNKLNYALTGKCYHGIFKTLEKNVAFDPRYLENKFDKIEIYNGIINLDEAEDKRMNSSKYALGKHTMIEFHNNTFDEISEVNAHLARIQRKLGQNYP